MLYPGTLNWHQGLDLAIRAFGRISDQVPQADFYIYGDGPTKEDLHALIRELHLENRVFICMPLPLREVANVIGSADLGIVPKRKDTFGNEAFSTKILEFMAMGVPVIVADTQVDRYYFDDSVVRFFPGGEEDDLARCILEMIQDPLKRETLVQNATKFVEQMPEVFQFPSREKTEKGFTYFQSFTAPELVEVGNPFMVPGRKLGIGKITDGSSNTLTGC